MGDSTPICRCRVLYLGSAVPRQSKDGLQGIQEPLRNLYPAEGAVGAKGIDSWLSVWSNGILLENVDENLKQITRFFPIESLHYCAAVRQVLIPERGNSNPEPKFLPLDSPFARMPRAQHPPIFAAILRRTTGIKVLECHVFICKREAAANALVRCCFHTYADNSYARQLETNSTAGSVYGTLKNSMGSRKSNEDLTNVGLLTTASYVQQTRGPPSQGPPYTRTESTTTLNSVGRSTNGNNLNDTGFTGMNINGSGSNGSAAEGYKNFYGSCADLNVGLDDTDISVANGDENHKIWSGSQDHLESYALESPYEIYSGNTSTLGRPVRARQISAPIAVPPPPSKEDKKKIKNTSKSSGSQSLSGTLIRPKPTNSATPQRPSIPGAGALYGPFGSVTGNVPSFRHYHTISHRGMHPGPSSFLHPVGQQGVIPQHPQTVHNSHNLPLAMPVPVLLPQQFATLQTPRSSKKKKKDKKSNGIPIRMPIVPSLYAYHHSPPPQPVIAQSLIGEPRPLAMSNRKLASSVGNGLDDSGHSGAESPGGTGIYRRKGHLNERAFSYSIRQEHRSRSHGSLASLQFNPPDLKKEREIAQMVAGLDLNDTEEHQFDSKSLQRNQANISNGYYNNNLHQQHNIFGVSNSTGIYGNEMTVSNNFEKPRR